jgi:soluble lytic murein transglycosylase
LKSTVVVLLLLLAAVLPVPAARAEQLTAADQSILREALSAAREGESGKALRLAAGAGNKLVAKAVRWKVYVTANSGASFADISGFLSENPGWPQPLTMQRRAEEAIGVATPADLLLAWFDSHPPITADGKTAYAQALLDRGRQDKGLSTLRDAWINSNFGTLQERQFLTKYGDRLREKDHEDRLARLLWDRQHEAAQRMIPKVNMPHRLLAQARIALQSDSAGASAAVDAVPEAMADDPGLLYDRVRWRRQKDLDDDAIKMLRNRNANKVRPEAWWSERAVLARRALQKGHISQAYDTAAQHGMTEGAAFADAEWLAGWIAFRYLQDQDVALRHFKRVHEAAPNPASRARGAYWIGRSADAMSDHKAAQQWYEAAARNTTAFYGQLAASRLTEQRRWPLPADPFATPEDTAAFERSEMVRVVHMMVESGLREDIDPFVLRINETAKTTGHRVLAARLAQASGRQDLAVNVARRADRDGVPMISYGYPVPPFKVERADKALVLALIRQESNFHQQAVSSAGARGLMQLMPATAKWMAKREKIAYQPQRLHDPDYNLQLGTAYLSELLDNFNGSMVLALASYNAGPGRARQWMRDYGDPRAPEVDAVDWVENIPFTETRNYVQRVMEGLQVYRRRLGVPESGVSLEKDLKR